MLEYHVLDGVVVIIPSCWSVFVLNGNRYERVERFPYFVRKGGAHGFDFAVNDGQAV